MTTYSDEQVEAIFRRALERQQAEADGLGHDELIAAAREVGLDERAIERAVHEIEDDRDEQVLAKEVKSAKRNGWLRHLFVYATIVSSMLGLHALGLIGVWVWWVVIGWGLGVALSLPRAFREPNEAELERAHNRKTRKQRRRARHEERQRERERRRLEQIAREQARQRGSKSAQELENVIEEGVALLLRAAANKLRDAQRQLDGVPPKGEFGRYVAKQKGSVQQEPEPAPPAKATPRVRVEVPEGDDEQEMQAPRRAREKRRR